MKITFNREEFTDAIKHLSLIVETGSNFTNSASCIRISPSEDGKAEIVGTDNVASLALRIGVVKSDDFTQPVLLPLGTVLKVVAHCISDEVSLVSKDTKDGISEIMFKAGNCKVKLQTTSVDMYPNVTFEVAGSVSASLPVKDVISGFDKTSVAILEGQNDRTELRGILLERKRGMNDVYFSATNGCQLSQYHCDGMAIGVDVEFRSTFPSKYVSTIIKLLQDRGGDGDVSLNFVSGKIIVITPGFSFSTSINERAFPDWERLLIDKNDYSVSITISPKELLDTIERVNAVSDNGMGSFAMGFGENELYMSAVNGMNTYHSTDSIPVDYSGEDLYFACNPKFFIKTLRKTDGDKITMCAGCVDKDSGRFLPVSITDGRYFNLILPLRGLPAHGYNKEHTNEDDK